MQYKRGGREGGTECMVGRRQVERDREGEREDGRRTARTRTDADGRGRRRRPLLLPPPLRTPSDNGVAAAASSSAQCRRRR